MIYNFPLMDQGKNKLAAVGFWHFRMKAKKGGAIDGEAMLIYPTPPEMICKKSDFAKDFCCNKFNQWLIYIYEW